VDLRIDLIGGNGFLATSPSEFRMRIDIDQPNLVPDPNDVLWWEICHWYDLGSPGRGDASEQSSWGGIKAMFR